MGSMTNSEHKRKSKSMEALRRSIIITLTALSLAQGIPAQASDVTNHLGNSWSSLNIPGNIPGVANWRKISVSSSGAVIAAITFNGGLYLSRDFGDSWRAVIDVGYSDLVDVEVSQEGNTITAYTTRQFFQSNDTGITWIEKVGTFDDHVGCAYLFRCIPNYLESFEGNRGSGGPPNVTSMLLRPGKIYIASETTGGGWQRSLSIQDYWNWTAMGQSADGTKLFAAAVQWSKPGPASALYVSTNSGNSFSLVSSVKNAQLGAISADGSTLVVASQNGNINVSRDMGLTWNSNGSPHEVNWKFQSSADGTKLFARENSNPGQREQSIFESLDSGKTWKPVVIPGVSYYGGLTCNENCTSVLVSGVVGVEWQLFRSDDGGQNWNVLQNVPKWFGLGGKLAVSLDGRVIIAATDEKLATSSDGGATWTTAEFMTQGCNYPPIISADGRSAVLLDCHGEMYTSRDEGVHWVYTPFPTNSVTSIAYSETLLIAATPKSIYTSTDFGLSWHNKLTHPDDIAGQSGISFHSVAVSSNGRVIIADETGPTVIISYDQGATWAVLHDFSIESGYDGDLDIVYPYSFWLNRDGTQGIICRRSGTCWLSSPTPLVVGSGVVGTLLSVNPGTWDSGVELSYQWLKSGVPVPHANTLVYLIAPTDLGSRISVSVSGLRSGFASVDRVSAAVSVTEATMVLSPKPLIVGRGVDRGYGVVGTSLSVNPGTWDSGVQLFYQWLKNGTPIVGEVGSEYLVAPSDLTSMISVSVLGVRSGVAPVRRVSGAVSVTAGTMVLSPNPLIVGSGAAGTLLSVNPGTWDSGVQLFYQWLKNGTPIVGEVGSEYLVAPSDLTSMISVSVLGVRSGVAPVRRVSGAVSVTAGTMVLSPNPLIVGSGAVGTSLSVNPGTWDSGVALSYQWLKNGNPIIGKAGPEYLVSASDFESSISVKVSGSKPGYIKITKISLATSVTPMVMQNQVKPKISGVAKVGNTLKAITSKWSPSAQITYNWTLGGRQIPGANGQTLKLLPSYKKMLVSVVVTQRCQGCKLAKRESASIRVS